MEQFFDGLSRRLAAMSRRESLLLVVLTAASGFLTKCNRGCASDQVACGGSNTTASTCCDQTGVCCDFSNCGGAFCCGANSVCCCDHGQYCCNFGTTCNGGTCLDRGAFALLELPPVCAMESSSCTTLDGPQKRGYASGVVP